jgi:diguanylate cyclase (GGDEF)-like protein
MISIRDSMAELEKLHALQEFLMDCYSSAIRDMEQYAVEIDDQVTPAHRQHLAAIVLELAARDGADNLTATRSRLRNELRDYRDRAAVILNSLRSDLSVKADALQAIVEAMASVDGDHDERMQKSLVELRKVAATPAAAPVRAALMEASDQIAASVGELKRLNGLTVSQFMFEIKTLHKRIETLETAGRKDVLTGLTTRVEMERLISAEIDRHSSFSLLLFRICNLPMIQRQFGSPIRAEVISALAKRLRGGLPAAAIVGRWSEDRFIALLAIEKSQAMGLAKRLTQHVSGTYVCMENGKPQRPDLAVNVSVIDHLGGGAYESLIARINQL